MTRSLLATFLAEGCELVDEASEGLLALERSPTDAEVINRVFRAFHTLKGNAGLFEMPSLIALLHVGEDFLAKVREQKAELGPERIDALLAAADAAGTYLDDLESEGSPSAITEAECQRIAELVRRLTESSEVMGRAPEPPSSSATSTPEPGDRAPESGQQGTDGPLEALPAWAEALPAALLHPGPTGPVTLVEYRPSDTCFFRGEDPLRLAASLPGVRWRSVQLDPERDSSDPRLCHLILNAISEANPEEIRQALHYVEEDVRIVVGPAEGTSDPRPEEAEGFEERLIETATTLIERQVAVLEASEDRAAESVRCVIERSLETLQHGGVSSEVIRLPQTSSVAELSRWIEGWRTQRMAKEESPAGSAQEGDPRGVEGRGPRTLRVEEGKVDRLMNLIGQLVVAKNGLPYLVRRLESHGDARAAARELKESAAVVDRIARELQSTIMEVRMMPVSTVFQRFPRLVRDVSRKLQKEIELTLDGESTHADKNVIEALSEPLIHLVRNALDHGIEPPSERSAKGKRPAGRIHLAASNENESVVIVVEDDGRGICPARVRDSAVRKGVIPSEAAERMSDAEAQMLIFAPGFSTRDEASELSGRGVGMDVVRATIERAGGRVRLDSRVGEGTRVTLELPLSMVVSRIMTVVVDGQLYGIGMDGVVETVRCPSNRIQTVKGREAIVLRDALVPVTRLRRLLSLKEERRTNAYGEEAILVLRHSGESFGLVVDELGENMEVLVRPLEGWMGHLGAYSGSAVLGDGRLLLILDMKELMRHGG